MGDSEKLSKVEVPKDRLDGMSKEELLEYFNKQTAYAEDLEKQIKKKEDEASARNLQQEATRREKFLVMRLTTKESESHDYLNQLDELRCSVSTAYRHTHLDPAVNVVFERMKKELAAHKEKYEQCQQELNAWKFTSDSTMGKKLMAKCRMLLTENDELGKMVSSGQIASLEGDIALSKMACGELRTAQNEAESMLWSLDEEMEGLQSVIVCLQQKLNAADINGEPSGGAATSDAAESAATAPPLEPDFTGSPFARNRNLAPPGSSAFSGGSNSSNSGNSQHTSTTGGGTPPVPSMNNANSVLLVRQPTNAAIPEQQLPMVSVSEPEPSFDPVPHAGIEPTNWNRGYTAAASGGQCSRTSTPELAVPLARTASPHLPGVVMSSSEKTTKQTTLVHRSGIVAISPPLVIGGSGIVPGGSSTGGPDGGPSKSDFDPGNNGVVALASFSSSSTTNQVVADPPASNRSFSKRRTPTPPAPGDSTSTLLLSSATTASPMNGALVVVSSSSNSSVPPFNSSSASSVSTMVDNSNNNTSSGSCAPFFSAMGGEPPPGSWKSGQARAGLCDDGDHPAVPVISSSCAVDNSRTLDEQQPLSATMGGSSGSGFLHHHQIKQKFPDTTPAPRQRGGGGDVVTSDPSPTRPPDRKRRRKAAPSSPELADPFHSNHASSSTLLNAAAASGRSIHQAAYGKGVVPQKKPTPTTSTAVLSRHVNGGGHGSPGSLMEDGVLRGAGPPASPGVHGHPGANGNNLVNGGVPTTPPCPGPGFDRFLDEETD